MNGKQNARNLGNERMPPNISRNVLKHSKQCPQAFQGMSPNIPVNIPVLCNLLWAFFIMCLITPPPDKTLTNPDAPNNTLLLFYFPHHIH